MAGFDNDPSHEDDVAEWFSGVIPQWRDAGHPVAMGPIPVSGWYIPPYCDEGCCDPFGPFASSADATAWAWRMAPRLAAVDEPAPPELLHELPLISPWNTKRRH